MQCHTANDDYHEMHEEKERQKKYRRAEVGFVGRDRQCCAFERETETPCGANSNYSYFLIVSSTHMTPPQSRKCEWEALDFL